jgi:hypothetical protein
LLNSRPVPDCILARYALEGAQPVEIDDRVGMYAHSHMAVPLSLHGDEVRHDGDRLAEVVLSALRARSTRLGVVEHRNGISSTVVTDDMSAAVAD